MKMNDTVARIVDLMFDNAEMTEEVTALRDEVMNNCQERYSDLVESGVPEDDAVAAVVESLKGMEDVIAQYRRKGRHAAAQQAAAEYTATEEGEYGDAGEYTAGPGARDMVFSPMEIHQIDLTLVSEDVDLTPSNDGMYHVKWICRGNESINCRADNGVLKVERLSSFGGDNAAFNVHMDGKTGKRGHIYVNGERIDSDEAQQYVDGVGSMLENLGRSLGRMFGGMKRAFNTSCDLLTICVPEGAIPHTKLVTTSGDLDVTNVALADLNIVTTSGDITVALNEYQNMAHMELRSTSGDVDVTAWADRAVLSSTSGDVGVEGRITELQVNTISGDIDVNADAERVTFKAISGDVELAFGSDELRDISGSTISGDIDVDLPMGVGHIAMTTSSRTGDITTRYSTNGFGPTVNGSISSMSGDITIR